MSNRHSHKVAATLSKFALICVISGTGVYVQAKSIEEAAVTTDTLMAKEVPGYLVGGDDRHSIPEVTEMVKQGQLTKAIEELNRRSNFSSNTYQIKALAREAFRLQCLKREFSTLPGEMLKKIQARIPDATESDLEQWTADNSLLWIPVDGEVRYFRREPGILLRLNPTAKARAAAHESGDPAAKSAGKFSFTGHMRDALDAAKDSGTSVVLPVRYSVTHTIRLKPGKVSAGEKLRCWLPYPREDVSQQSSVKLVSMEPGGKISSDSDSAQRTVYFEQPAGNDGSAKFELKFEYTCAALVADLAKARQHLSDKERQDLVSYLEPRSPHLLLTPEVRALSDKIVGDKTSVVEKAYAIWSWIDENIPWCPEMEYAVMPNIVSKVLAVRQGDCGTQALTFIALSRAAGVPARWQSGWVMKPGSWNLHDWAEFYAPGLGWVPVDPSVGRQESTDPEVRDFLFGHMDAYRMIANSDHNAEFSPPKYSPRSDPVDNQRGELEWAGGNLGYDDWSYDVDVTYP